MRPTDGTSHEIPYAAAPTTDTEEVDHYYEAIGGWTTTHVNLELNTTGTDP